MRVLVLAIALTLCVACEPTGVVGVDSGSSAEEVAHDAGRAPGPDAGFEDAGYAEDASFSEDAGSATDAGPDVDAGPSNCSDAFLADGPFCEDDTDFCDAVGDMSRSPTKDIVAAWSRQVGDTFIAQIRFAGPAFTGYVNHYNLWLRAVGDPLDVGPVFGFVQGEPTEAPGHAGSTMLAVMRQSTYVPNVVEYICSFDDATQALPGCVVDFDPCDAIFVSADRKTVEFHIPVPEGSVIESSWFLSPDTVMPDWPDGFTTATFVPSKGGQQDNVSFSSICGQECPSADAE